MRRFGLPVLVLAALAGCSSAHRLVAPLAYEPGGPSVNDREAQFGAPPVVAPSSVHCATWTKLTLSNGIPVFVTERRELPIASFRVLFAHDPGDGPLDFGVDPTDRSDVLGHDSSPDLGVERVHLKCGPTACWIAETVGPARLGERLARLAARVQAANGDERAGAAPSPSWEHSGLTNVVWHNAAVMALGWPPTEEALRPIDRAFALDAATATRLLRPEATSIFVAGEISASEVQAQAEAAFGGWSSPIGGPESPTFPNEPEVPASFAPRVARVARSGPYSALVVRGPPSDDADAWAFQVALGILGGGIGSEIFTRVREELRASYGPGAATRWLRHDSLTLLGGVVDRGKVIAATRAMLAAVRTLRANGPDAAALAQAKSSWKAQWMTRLASSRGLVSSLEVQHAAIHPFDLCAAATRIDAVTAGDIQQTMDAYFAEKRLGVLIVARDDELDDWPSALGLGKEQERDWLGRDAR